MTRPRPPLSDLENYNGPDQIVSSYEIEERIKLKKQNKGDDLVVMSGIPDLDRLTDGFREGNMILIAGPSGHGKTLLAQTITYHLCQKKTETDKQIPLFFSFEMPSAQFLRCFPTVPYFYMPNEIRPYSWDWFVERCRENLAKHDGKVIFIDHLHFLLHFFQSSSPSLQIGKVARDIKTLALEYGFIIFLLCHITKIPEGSQANMSHIRDSGLIACEADTVLMVQRRDKDEDETGRAAKIIVEKCRETGVFRKFVQVHKANGYLEETSRLELK